jgi:diguanylate cyclase (GGDEF)-like protein/PAS domain S-box-containing protein
MGAYPMSGLREPERRERQLDIVSATLVVGLLLVIILLMYLVSSVNVTLPIDFPLTGQVRQVLLVGFVLMVLLYLSDQRRRLRSKVAVVIAEAQRLVVELEESRAEVVRQRDELEVRVDERTSELSQAVLHLTHQVHWREVAESAQADSELRYRTLVENLSDVIFTMGSDGRLGFVSAASIPMLGVKPEDMRGKTIDLMIGPRQAELVMRRISRGLPAKGLHMAIDGLASDGGPLDLDMVLTTVADGEQVQGILRDVTVRRRQERELVHLASHDFLTGLFNRRRFEDELAHALTHFNVDGEPGAVFWLDLDAFKDVNDTLGHKAGDYLLGKVARTLSETVRPECIVARLGGDEFAILIPSIDAQSAIVAAQRLIRAVSELQVELDGHMFGTSACLGIVLYPNHGKDIDDLLSRADMAMYQAKEAGPSQFVLYDPAREWSTGIEERRVWTDVIEKALDEGGLRAFAQPIVDLASGKFVAYELLVRISDFENSIMLPDLFLPIAEKTGLIVDIDIWMMRQAIQLLAENPRGGFRLNVNASVRTLLGGRYLGELTDALATSGVDPGRVAVEITETAVIVDIMTIVDAMERIKKLGCRVVLDDFGSGFTSFLQLKQLSVDEIKIDGSYVHDIEHSTDDQHLVRAMTEMAKGLGIETTAEFVASQACMDMLRSFGVDMAQGYFIGEPCPAADVVARRGVARVGKRARTAGAR